MLGLVGLVFTPIPYAYATLLVFRVFLLLPPLTTHVALLSTQEALKRRLNARIEYAKFLQDTVKEMAKEVQNSRSGEIKKTAEDLDDFLNNVRKLALASTPQDNLFTFQFFFFLFLIYVHVNIHHYTPQ